MTKGTAVETSALRTGLNKELGFIGTKSKPIVIRLAFKAKEVILFQSKSILEIHGTFLAIMSRLTAESTASRKS